MKKVVIVGAGPGGLFAAYELAKTQKYEVAVIDKGKDVDSRSKKELNCGIGGAGLYSDGKLIYHTKVGTFLWEIVGIERVEELNNYVESIFKGYNVGTKAHNEVERQKLEELRIKSVKAGIDFVVVEEAHVGTNKLVELVQKFKDDLIRKNVQFCTEEEVIKVNENSVYTNKGKHPYDYLVLAPGREGSEWLEQIVQRDFKFEFEKDYVYNSADIGVRVEVKREITDEVTSLQRDMKFIIREAGPSKRRVRTFCTCPGGEVVMERPKGKDYNRVNGHSEEGDPYPNTNFAFIVSIPFKKPQINSNIFARYTAMQAYTLSAGNVLLQRFGDIKSGRRSKEEDIKEWGTQPSLKEAVAGSVTMHMPYDYMVTILDGMEKLNLIIPGVTNNDTLLYSPEIKEHSLRPSTDEYLQTHAPNVYVAGDGPGLTRGIVAAAGTGVLAARGIMRD